MEKEKKRICWIRVVKNISYFVAPFLVTALILSIVSVIYAYDVGMAKEGEEYYQTTKFAERYFSSISNSVEKIMMKEETNIVIEGTEITKDSLDKNVIENNQYDYGYFENRTSNFLYLIIDNKNDVIYANQTNGLLYDTSTERLKEEISSNALYWIYENGEVRTTIERLNGDVIKNTNLYEEELQQGDYTIYTALIDGLPYYDSYLGDYILYSVVKYQYDTAIYTISILIVLFIAMKPMILIGIGKTKNAEGVYLTWFDKLPIEVSTGLILLVTFLFCGVTFGIGTNITAIISIICIILGFIGIYIAVILFMETIVKRLKTHTFIKTTIAYWLFQKMKLIFEHMKISLRVGILFAGFVIGNWLIFAIFMNEPFVAFVLLMTLYAISFIYVLKRVIWQDKINHAIEQIYKGNTEVRIDESELKNDFKKVAIQVNDIAGGFSNAVEEQLKSERLKTELITNVSHDIKTPLTSIINYVNLLKKEDITTEKAAEYLAILDSKSQRLKKLTEDLVEASKASSGNIKMNMEKLEVNELIKQVSAEFEDKFKAHGLTQVSTFTKEPVYIKADSRYMYRVLENMYS